MKSENERATAGPDGGNWGDRSRRPAYSGIKKPSSFRAGVAVAVQYS